VCPDLGARVSKTDMGGPAGGCVSGESRLLGVGTGAGGIAPPGTGFATRSGMDVSRKSAKRMKMIRRGLIGTAGLVVIAMVTVGVYGLEPAAPGSIVEPNTTRLGLNNPELELELLDARSQ
jgi:hypothetical protein